MWAQARLAQVEGLSGAFLAVWERGRLLIHPVQSVLDSPPSPHTFRVGSYGPFPPSSSGSSRASTASHYTNPPSAHSSPPSSEAWSAAGSPILSPQGSAWNHLPPPTQRLPSPPQHPSRPPPRRPSSSSTQHSPTDYFQPPLLPIHIHGVRPAPRSTNERGGTSEEDLVRDPGHLSRAGSLVGGGRRAGSTASGEDARTETMGARTPTLSLGVSSRSQGLGDGTDSSSSRRSWSCCQSGGITTVTR